MKRIFAVFAFILLMASVFAQSPEKMSYQAVIRNSSNQLVTNTQIGMEINILQGSVSGSTVYTETQTPTTNANGLVSIEIGGGAGFSNINWANYSFFIETKTAVVAPLTTYTIIGVSQLLSVPYALNAKTAQSITGTITETDPVYTGSQAAYITETDISNLSNLSGTNTGDQTIADVATINNSVNSQLKNVTDPTDAQDAATKAYVDELKERIDMIELSLHNVLATVWTSDTTGRVKDIDGNVYQFVRIGDQFWLTKNLLTKRYSNGDSIVSGSGQGNICGELTPKYYFERYDNEYGLFYSSYVVTDSRNVCPTGWHVPSYSDFIQLRNYIANEGSLKEIGYEHWNSPNEGATDSHNFTALPNGYVDCNGAGYDSRVLANFWSNTDYADDNDFVWRMRLSKFDNNIDMGVARKNGVGGFAVRCIKNND